MRKPTFCICKNKEADQLHRNRKAYQRLCFRYIYFVQKETQCFYLQFLGLKRIDVNNCFFSVVLPSNKDIDCIVSSLNGYRALF